MSDVPRHYAGGGLAEAFATSDDPALDQFHLGGIEAVRALMRLADFPAGASVLDIGGGLGGPARLLAAEAGARVTVVDLTEAFCRAGAAVARRRGLGGRVAFRTGDATALPFAEAAFDGAWILHGTMNVADKPRLFAEARRILRPGGRFALWEICEGPVRPVRFPVPWAGDPSLSFLEPPETFRVLAASAGLRELAWEDATEALRARPDGPPSPGLALLFGEDRARLMAANMRSNLDEDRIRVVRGLFLRP